MIIIAICWRRSQNTDSSIDVLSTAGFARPRSYKIEKLTLGVRTQQILSGSLVALGVTWNRR